MISGVIKSNEGERRHRTVYLHALPPALPSTHSQRFTPLLNNMTFLQGQADPLMCGKCARVHLLTLSFTLIISRPYHLVSRQSCLATIISFFAAVRYRNLAKKKILKRQHVIHSHQQHPLLSQLFFLSDIITSSFLRYSSMLIINYCNPTHSCKSERTLNTNPGR